MTRMRGTAVCLFLAALSSPSDAFTIAPSMLRAQNTRAMPLLRPAKGLILASPLSSRPSSLIASTPRSSTLLDGSAGMTSGHSKSSTYEASNTVKKAAVLLSLCIVVGTIVFSASPALAAASSKAAAPAMSPIKRALKFVLHLDKELAAITAKYGTATYAILWGIVFAETGLVITPFLPGDSLLFACGALCALGSLNLGLTCATFLTAAILGDAVNYAIGNKVGPKAFEADTFFLKKKNLKKTQDYYAKYGGKTIVLARFVPIVRTFAPFVAGVGSMDYSKFALYNVFGGIIWTVLFTGAGFVFGNIPVVQHNFTLVVLAIVAVSVVPVIYEVIQAGKDKGEDTPDSGATTS